RGKPDCGDIDILITRLTDDGKTHRGLLRRLLGELHAQGILTEDLCLPDNLNDLELVYRGLCRRDAHSNRYALNCFTRLGLNQDGVDSLTIPYESRGATLLYYTVSVIANYAGIRLTMRPSRMLLPQGDDIVSVPLAIARNQSS
ncbi:hypothetical protein CERSUDRAFT_60700, partial [Gelatoporia subvermispora B]